MAILFYHIRLVRWELPVAALRARTRQRKRVSLSLDSNASDDRVCANEEAHDLHTMSISLFPL